MPLFNKVKHPVSFMSLLDWYVPGACYHNALRLADEIGGTPVDGVLLNDTTGGVIAHRWVKREDKHWDFVGYEGWTYYESEDELWISEANITMMAHKVVDHLNNKYTESIPDELVIL